MLVDDEELVTQSLGSFLELETDYRIICFQSPETALERLHQGAVDVVISDFLMPQMDGLQFLTAVKELYPNVPRLLLTGYADKENAIKAINAVGLYQYLEKPWDNDQLQMIIRNALASKNLNELLEKKIGELERVLSQRDKLAVRDDLFQQEMGLARQMQENMLPSQLPASNGIAIDVKYTPALEIGGDFYDVISLAEGRLAMLIADATGHGIQAALSTALVKFAFAGFSGKDVTSADILRGMNSVLFKGLPSHVFVAAMVLTIDSRQGQCHVANGGLPPPIVLRAGQPRVEKIPATGLLLGIADDDVYRPGDEFEVNLECGDTLFLYTDGLSETENATGEFFDRELLSKTMLDNVGRSAGELVNILATAASEFRGTAQEPDDLTIIGIDRLAT